MTEQGLNKVTVNNKQPTMTHFILRYDELEQKSVETLQYIHDIRPERAGARTTRPSIPVSEEQKLALGGLDYSLLMGQSLFKHGRRHVSEYIELCNQQHTVSMFYLPPQSRFLCQAMFVKANAWLLLDWPCSTNCLEICVDDKPFSCKACLNGLEAFYFDAHHDNA